MIYLNNEVLFGVTLFLSRFFYKTCISIHVTLCNELFPTPIRVLGNGFVFSLGRLAGSLSPYIAYDVMKIDLYLPFFFVGLLICLAALNTTVNIKDTRNAELDSFENDANYNQSLNASILT